MPTPRTAAAPLVFRGSPRRLKLLSNVPDSKDLEFEPDKSLTHYVTTGRQPFRQKKNRAGELQDLRVKLNANTPPGLYMATVKTKGKSLPVEIHVEEHTRVTVTPTRLSISGKSGSKVTISAMFINRGNTAIEIPRTDAIGIYDDKGLETAFASTYRQDSEDINELLKHFIGKLRAGHGGLLKLRLTKGYGLLEPEERALVEIEAQIPSRLKPGHHFHGVWRVASINFAIKLAVIK
jgi:hypothetical protein